MIILSFDSSSNGCCAGVYNIHTQKIVTKYDHENRRQAERLVPLMQSVLSEAGHVWGDITHLATLRGPGSFTGLRIALSAAKALQISLNIKALTCDSFTVFAHQCMIETKTLILIDTLRGDWYGQVTDLDGTALQDARIWSMDDVQAYQGDKLIAPQLDLCIFMTKIADGMGEEDKLIPIYLREAEVSLPKNPIKVRDDLFRI